jgi:hypothetical protein
MVLPAERSGGLPPVRRAERPPQNSPVRFADVVDAVRKEGRPASGTQGAPAQAPPVDPPKQPPQLTDPAKTIADDRRRSIDDWVGGADDSFWPWNDDSHDKVAHALRGNSELGGLTGDERRYLVDRALDKWIREGETYSSPRDLARDVRGDGTLGPLVAERYAVKAAALEAEQRRKPASDRNGDAVDIGGAAIVALNVEPGRKTDAAQQAALRQLVEKLGPSKAAGLAESLSSPGLETEYASATLEALNAGPFTDSAWAFTTSAFSTTQEQRYGQGTDLSMPMAKALARGLFPQDPQRQQQEAQRIGDLLSSPAGRSLLTPPNAVLGEDKVGPERRAQALAVVLQTPEITAGRLMRDGFDPWASPLIAVPIAQDSADRALAASRQTPEAAADRLGGGSGVGIPEELRGAQLDNRVGRAMNLPPEGISADTPPDKLKQLKDAAARGEHSFYTTGDNAETVRKITATIRELGGDTARVTVLPIQYSSRQTGPVQLPLFRVEGKDGKTWFVDNLGARYDSFGKWTDKNQLPPGNVTYPKGGELKPGPDGKVALDSRNTPKTPDTIGEQRGRRRPGGHDRRRGVGLGPRRADPGRARRHRPVERFRRSPGEGRLLQHRGRRAERAPARPRRLPGPDRPGRDHARGLGRRQRHRDRGGYGGRRQHRIHPGQGLERSRPGPALRDGPGHGVLDRLGRCDGAAGLSTAYGRASRRHAGRPARIDLASRRRSAAARPVRIGSASGGRGAATHPAARRSPRRRPVPDARPASWRRPQLSPNAEDRVSSDRYGPDLGRRPPAGG